MSDVTGVCLTMGEETTERALESIRRQTLPVADTIVVEGVEPFHRAFNLATSRVETPFFIQVDADMVLDPTCVADLRASIHPEAVIAAGLLRDPLAGRVPAVKLFRMAPLEGQVAPNTVTPEIDHYLLLAEAGWLTLYVLGGGPGPAASRYTFGEHRPDYTLPYTYATYALLGAGHRRYRNSSAFAWRVLQLRRSVHPMAVVGRVALARGIFLELDENRTKRDVGAGDIASLSLLLENDATGGIDPDAPERLLGLGPDDLFDEAYALGRRIGGASAGAAARRALAILADSPGRNGLLAEIGLCRGLLPSEGFESTEPDRELLRERFGLGA